MTNPTPEESLKILVEFVEADATAREDFWPNMASAAELDELRRKRSAAILTRLNTSYEVPAALRVLVGEARWLAEVLEIELGGDGVARQRALRLLDMTAPLADETEHHGVTAKGRGTSPELPELLRVLIDTYAIRSEPSVRDGFWLYRLADIATTIITKKIEGVVTPCAECDCERGPELTEGESSCQ